MPDTRHSFRVLVKAVICLSLIWFAFQAIYWIDCKDEMTKYGNAVQSREWKIGENWWKTRLYHALSEKDSTWPAIKSLRAIAASGQNGPIGNEGAVSLAETVSRMSEEDKKKLGMMPMWKYIKALAECGELPYLIKLRDEKMLEPALKGEIKPYPVPPMPAKPVLKPFLHPSHAFWFKLIWIFGSIIALIQWSNGESRHRTDWKSIWPYLAIIITAPASLPRLVLFAIAASYRNWDRLGELWSGFASKAQSKLRVACYRYRIIRRLPAPVIQPLTQVLPPEASRQVVTATPVAASSEIPESGLLWYVFDEHVILGRRDLLAQAGLEAYPIAIRAPENIQGIGVKASDLVRFESALGLDPATASDERTDIERTAYRRYAGSSPQTFFKKPGKKTKDFVEPVLQAVSIATGENRLAFMTDEHDSSCPEGFLRIVICLGYWAGADYAEFRSVLGHSRKNGQKIGGCVLHGYRNRHDVRDRENNVIATVLDGTICLLWNFRKCLDEEWTADALAKTIISAIAAERAQTATVSDDEIAKAWRDGVVEAKTRYVELCSVRVRKEMEGLTEQVENCEKGIREAGLTITRLTRERIVANRRLEAFRRGDLADEKKSLESEFDQLAASSYVLAVRAVDERIEVDTKAVIIKHEGESYRIGRLTVMLFEDGSVRFRNNERRNGPVHPHIDSSGKACFGNIAEAIAKLMGERQFAGAMALISRYLESYNPNSPISGIADWPRIKKEEAA